MLDQRSETVDTTLVGPVGGLPVTSGSRLHRWRKSLLGEMLEIAAIAIVLFLVVRLAVQNYRVNGSSMNNTLHNGEFVLVDKISYDFSSPHRGDIIVFKYPVNPTEDFIKRVIAVPGDRVTIHSGAVYVDGQRLRETYVKARPAYTMLTIPTTTSDVVPKNEYFVLGDNRNDSDDSHLWGLVPRKDIIGRALISYWPPQDFGIFHDPSVGLNHDRGRQG